MKKLMISMLAMAAMVSCSSEGILDNEEPVINGGLVPIKLNASIIGVETKAAVDGSTDIPDIAILKADTKTADISTFKWASATDIKNETATFNATSKSITLNDNKKLYYPSNPDESAVIGAFYPKSLADGTISSGVVTFKSSELTAGDKDIMWANVATGTKAKKDEALNLDFGHKLSQLQFSFIKDASFTSSLTVKEIVIKGTKLPKSINVDTGTITYEDAASDITITQDIALDSTPNAITVLVEANASPSITLDITLSDNSKIENVAISDLTTNESAANKVELTFKQQEINATASIASWSTGSTGKGNVI